MKDTSVDLLLGVPLYDSSVMSLLHRWLQIIHEEESRQKCRICEKGIQKEIIVQVHYNYRRVSDSYSVLYRTQMQPPFSATMSPNLLMLVTWLSHVVASFWRRENFAEQRENPLKSEMTSQRMYLSFCLLLSQCMYLILHIYILCETDISNTAQSFLFAFLSTFVSSVPLLLD